MSSFDVGEVKTNSFQPSSSTECRVNDHESTTAYSQMSLYRCVGAHSDTFFDLEMSVSDPIRSWTLVGCITGAPMLTILVLFLVCCGCGGSRISVLMNL